LDKANGELWVSIGKHLSKFTPYENVCFVSEKPIRATFSEQNVLSYDHGPAQEYADGYGIYMLDGVRLTKEEWQKIVNQEFTLGSLAKAGMGADKSAVAMKYLRPDRLLEGMGAKLIHTGIKGTELYRVDEFTYHVSGGSKLHDTEYCMKMKHPSLDTFYIEWVDPKIGAHGDADLCQANAFGIPLEDYLLAVEA